MRMHALHTPLRIVSSALAGAVLLTAASTATAETRTIPGTDVTATDCPGCSEAQMRTIVGTFDYGHHHFYDLSARVLRSFRKNCEQDPWLGRPDGDDRGRKPRPEGEPAPSFFGCNGTVLVFETIPDYRVQREFDAVVEIWHGTGGTMKRQETVGIDEFPGYPGTATTAREIAGDGNRIAGIEDHIERVGVGTGLSRFIGDLAQTGARVIGATDNIFFRITVQAPDGSRCGFTYNGATRQAELEPRSCFSPGNQWIPSIRDFPRIGGTWEEEAAAGYSGGEWMEYMRGIGADMGSYVGPWRYVSCSFTESGEFIGCVEN